MKSFTTQVLVSIAAILTATASFAQPSQTESDGSALVYNNPGAVHAIPDAPNPIPARVSTNAEVIYVNPAFGPAIYSYPGNAPEVKAEFDPRYVDAAHGQAIASYPYNKGSRDSITVEGIVRWINDTVVAEQQ